MAAWIARSAVTAWIGAAGLFVMVGVREVTTPEFSSEIRDRLVVVRFPLFYATGFFLVGLGWLLSAVIPRAPQMSGWRTWTICGLLTVALIGMVGDYIWIYLPLEQMVTPPGQPRTQQFIHLHEWSARINSINLVWCLIAASLMNWQSVAIPSDNSVSV
ncbi:hypothetical protein GC163_16300 [bacterium]|nr:hypothetical protein [bacterium]